MSIEQDVKSFGEAGLPDLQYIDPKLTSDLLKKLLKNNKFTSQVLIGGMFQNSSN